MNSLKPKAVENLLRKAADSLKGSSKRIFIAQTIEAYGHGGQSWAEERLLWNRGTIRKGKKELATSTIEDKFSARGRKKSEEVFPDLLDDIKKIVEPEYQTDPSFNTCRLYTRITATEVRKRLLELDDYTEDTIPCAKTCFVHNRNPQSCHQEFPTIAK